MWDIELGALDTKRETAQFCPRQVSSPAGRRGLSHKQEDKHQINMGRVYVLRAPMPFFKKGGRKMECSKILAFCTNLREYITDNSRSYTGHRTGLGNVF